PPALTPGQVDVLRLVAEGRSNKAVAAALDIAEKTVKAHLAAIFLALGADNRTHAIALARAARLIP
ncbi:helix-turn-helix domain-containing protein, partial [Enterococcus gallinarum]|uniref:helix-turn-helix domain-containing protein n=1 Tax=Enterococcus gallinarum TaxID=1353 RepID=UPI003D135DE4